MDERAIRGYSILAKGDEPQAIGNEIWSVPSQSSDKRYMVARNETGWHCECPDHMFRNVECKHIHAVQFSISLKEKLKIDSDSSLKIQELVSCRHCGSPNIVRYGKRGRKQLYMCKDCELTFVPDDYFKRMKFQPTIITTCLDLYYKGVSTRGICDHLHQLYGLKITHVTLLNWISKYAEMIEKYVKTLKPEVSNRWHVDEMKVKFHGDWRWLWNMMDSQTRYLLASTISEKREIEDARRIFIETKLAVKGKKPNQIVTDGLEAYEQAFKKEFFTLKGPRTEHVQRIQFSRGINNNLIERLHGTKRDREKVMRGLKKEETRIVVGQDIYYNYVKPHMALKGLTPAEVAKTDEALGRNKWLGLIKKSQTQSN